MTIRLRLRYGLLRPGSDIIIAAFIAPCWNADGCFRVLIDCRQRKHFVNAKAMSLNNGDNIAVVVMTRVRNHGWKLLELQKTPEGQKSRTIENQKASMVLKRKLAEL